MHGKDAARSHQSSRCVIKEPVALQKNKSLQENYSEVCSLSWSIRDFTVGRFASSEWGALMTEDSKGLRKSVPIAVYPGADEYTSKFLHVLGAKQAKGVWERPSPRVSPAEKLVKKTRKVKFRECALMMISSAAVPLPCSSGCADSEIGSDHSLAVMRRKRRGSIWLVKARSGELFWFCNKI